MVKPINPPYAFATGQTFDVNKVNTNFDYLKQRVDRGVENRFVTAQVTMPFSVSAATPITQIDSQQIRRYSFKALHRCSIDRGFLRFFGTADGTVQIELLVNGATPSGFANPYLSLPSASFTDEVYEAFNGAPVVLNANDVVTLEMKITGGLSIYSSKNSFVTLQIKSDRHNLTGVNLVSDVTIDPFESETAFADGFNGKISTIQTAVTQLLADNTNIKWEYYTLWNITPATAVRHRTYKIPRQLALVGKRTIVAARLWAGAVALGGATVQYDLVDTFGNVYFTQQVVIPAGQLEAAADATILIADETGLSGAAANDLTLTCTHVAGVNIAKTTAQITMQ